MSVIGNSNFNVCSRKMRLIRSSLQNVGNSIQFISIKSMISHNFNHKPICKFSIVVKSPALNLIQCCSSSANPRADTRSTSALPTNGMGLSDTSMESTFTHRLWVSIGCGALLAMTAKSMLAMDSHESVLAGILSAYVGYVFADLGTGIYHWGIDNYGNANTPIFGSQIDAFQGHHKRPWTITKRAFANNIHALARPASFVLGIFLLLPDNVALDSFATVATGCIVFSQQFHCWAHSKKRELPPIVVRLQEMGVLVPRVMHGVHHRAPYDSNYCIVSGMWNKILDRSMFFRKLEMLIYARWGVRPRCWDETAAEWLQDGSYFADGSNEHL